MTRPAILLVEPAPRLRSLMRSYHHRESLVLYAGSAERARELIARWSPEAVLVSCAAGAEDEELVGLLRETRAQAPHALRIILLPGAAARAMAWLRNAHRTLPTPTTPEEVESVVAHTMSLLPDFQNSGPTVSIHPKQGFVAA